MDGTTPSALVGQRNKLIGRLHEQRFFRVMDWRNWSFPSWYLGTTPATPEQDRHGIDAVVELDVISVPIQIKSSAQGKSDHTRQHHAHCGLGEYTIVVIIVQDVYTDEMIRTDTLSMVFQKRERFFKEARR